MMKLLGIGTVVALLPVVMMNPVVAQEAPADKQAMPMDHGTMNHDAMHQDVESDAAMPAGQDAGTMDHGTMDHGAMDHSAIDHSAMSHDDEPNAMPGMHEDHAMADADNMDMSGDAPMTMDMSGAQGGKPPANARDPHAWSDGVDFIRQPRPRMADEEAFSMLSFDRLENSVSHGDNVLTWDVQGWYGRDFDRAVFKSEGDYDNGKVEEASNELLWSHAISGFFNRQLGVRYDTGEGPDRGWLAFGFQGLAPYWFEVDATGYVGEHGQVAFTLETEYDLFLTQRLILQPRLEANVYGKSEPAYGLGKGLNDLSAGLRLQYQFRREITAYGGVEWAALFGDARDMARAGGNDGRDTRFVAGLRLWF